jgi:Asp-tRNA(Asn)/Glu-tRNA(Gln) amidotransferase A subunit family amidase
LPLDVDVQASMSDLVNLTATAAAEAIRRGEITSEALVEACLARIAARENEVGAWAHLDPAYARAAARVADQARRAGQGTGPLHGVPIGVKDIIDTADQPTEHGCPIFQGRRPTRDAAVVTQLRNAGAIVLGKTVTTELALLTPAATRNPRGLEHTPGGSSAGSAAAVADGMVPAALGTQTAGSVLRPASYCGVYGFKPTYGLLPRAGVLMQSHTLDTAGVLARSLEDVALLTDCMALQEPDDPASYSRSQPSLAAEMARPAPLPPLFAFVKTPAWETDAAMVMKEAFAELVAALGAQVEEVELSSLGDAIAAQRTVQLAENAAYYGPLLRRHPDMLSKGLRERLETGLAIKAHELVDAVRLREPLYAAVEELLTNYTAIITPAAPGPAPALSEGITGSPIFNGLWTYLGCPCVSVPLIEADGLPIGVQLVGARRDDGRLLRTAKWLVQHLSGSA